MIKHPVKDIRRTSESCASARTSIFRLTSALVLSFATIGPAAVADPVGSGYGWDPLEARIDQKVVAYMQDNHVAGMTIAISKNGRLVLSKGYGGKSSPNGTDMNHDTRTRIGSNSKPLVTGPAGVQMLQRLGIKPETKKLYGDGGVFRNEFAQDIVLGVNRNSPVVAMAIGKDDRVYSWLLDGTYVVGTSFDLQRHQAPRPYALPSGKQPADVIDVAVSAPGTFTTYYNDGTSSTGWSANNLGQMNRTPPKFEELTKTRFPGERSILNVVGIGGVKGSSRTYFWYDDGKVSAGSHFNAAAYKAPYGYSLSEGTPYRIRGMGIASDDRVYTWLINATAQTGTSWDLDKHTSPYPVAGGIKGPRNPNVFNWYYGITLQHLLDHRAGFQHSGDAAGAAAMFGKSKDSVSYDEAHAYMLRTRPLRFAPDDGYAYSNHGYGLWTIIVPHLSGKSYEATGKQDFLINQVKLSPTDVRPQTLVADARDAAPMYHTKNGGFGLYPHKDAGIGLAAGGWTASAEDLLRISEYLTSTYSFDALARMGWGVDGTGNKRRLQHSGSTGGGDSYVGLFHPNYVSLNGTDLGDIQIAVNTNTSTDGGALRALAHDIVFDVPAADIAPWYNAWNLMN